MLSRIIGTSTRSEVADGVAGSGGAGLCSKGSAVHIRNHSVADSSYWLVACATVSTGYSTAYNP